MEECLPIASLAVAFLAVFFGPILSWRIAKKQIESTTRTSNKQIISPMRQAWINSLRDLLAEITSKALHYYLAGFEDRTDDEYKELTFLEAKISLMLNINEEDHQNLEKYIRQMVASLSLDTVPRLDFQDAHKKTIQLSRKILKREWDRVKID